MNVPDTRLKLGLSALIGASGVACFVAMGYIWGARSASASAPVAEVPSTPELVAAQPAVPLFRRDEEATQRAPPPEPQGPDHGPVPPAPPPKTPAQVREETVTELRASGPGTAEQLAQARAAGAAWSALASKHKMEAKFSDWVCYARGCFSDALQSSPGDVQKLTNLVSGSREFHQWQGGKLRTRPIDRANGQVQVTWVLFTKTNEATKTKEE